MPPKNFKILPNRSEDTVTIPVSQIAEFWEALVNLKMHIEQAPADSPLIWIGDNKTPVKQLLTFKYAERAITDAEIILEIVKDRNNGANVACQDPQ